MMPVANEWLMEGFAVFCPDYQSDCKRAQDCDGNAGDGKKKPCNVD